MEHLPIDIHSNKLLDWLLSRRHCPKNWREAVEAVRSKISHAIQDMPENEQILTILSNAQYINYFHCKQIVDILRETEKETKNIFGMYSSQRMKDWKEIISLYEKDNVYLAEAANFLQRFVQYEVPALRKQIAKAENTSGESERKERDYAKQAAESRRNLDKDLAKWSLSAKVRDLRGELVSAANATQPTELGVVVGTELGRMVAYFDQFSTFVGKQLDGMFPIARFLLASLPQRPLSALTVFEWRHGRRPNAVVPQICLQPLPLSPLDNEQTEEAKEDEIDFGEEEDEIDFCSNGNADAIELISDEADVPPVADDGIARGEEALPVLDHLGLRTEFLDELDQLASFMDFRLQDELTECGASIYLDGMAQKPCDGAAQAGVEELRAWLTELKRTSAELSEPNKMQRLRMRTSPRFVDEIVAQLEQKRRLEAKYLRQEQLSAQRLTQCAAEIRSAQKLLDGVVEAAKGLQEELEKDLSKRYNGREVYIMGEINAVLYGS
uniref:CDK5 regulatory subunit-associated protein 3 n=1 Tax=Globodera pallida TaxID=36090 RepID=A0A183CL08_GLOPA